MFEIEDILSVVRDVTLRFEREIEQGLRNRNLDSAIYALAGKDACQRIENELQARYGAAMRIHQVNTRTRKG